MTRGGQRRGLLVLAMLGLVACSGRIGSSGGASNGGPDGVGGSAGNFGSAGSGGASAPVIACPKEPLGVSAASPRLTERQLRNTLAVLFPFPIDIGSKYPSPTFKHEFTTFPRTQEILFSDVQSLTELAESIAVQASAKLSMVLPCNPTNNEPACARQFIETFGPRAFRRPLETAERDRLIELYDSVRRAPDPLEFNLAIGAVIAAVIQSPPFLYRLELGEPTMARGTRKLTPYETAARLSYLLLDAPPDAPLAERARTNTLSDARARETEAKRLLDDPRARDSVWRFFSEWLGVGDQVHSSRVEAAVAADLAEEAKRFVLFAALDKPKGALEDLLATKQTFLSRRLAQHYGVPFAGGADGAFTATALPDGLAAGILSKGQVAMAHSAPGETSVVLRGVFLLESLACAELGAPPPGVQDLNPVLPNGASVRERMEARMQIPQCGGCHRRIDNAGIGMEDVDAFGRFRTTYAAGRTVDAAGLLAELGPDGTTWDGTADLAKKLAARPEVAACLARQWYRFALGHEETDTELRCHVATLSARFAEEGHDLRALLASIAASDAFVLRAEAEAP